MDINIIDEIKSLNQTMVKWLFQEHKLRCLSNRPKPLQMEILKFLIDHSKEEICQKDLEKQFKISKSAISFALDSMEKNNLIERVSSDEDARKRNIVLTEKSLEMNKEIIKGLNNVNKEIINCLTKEDIDDFLRISKKLKEFMKEGI